MSGIKHCRGPWAALAVAVTTAALGSHTAPAATADAKLAVQALKITVLVTNLAGDPREGQGEWGYSALVEADGHKILYDTGASADLVLRNARALKIDLSDVEDVVLSHNHWDHVNGLMTLRSELSKINPRAMSRVHVGAGIFQPRLTASGGDSNGLKDIRAQYIATGGAFIVHDRPTQLWPGVWFTGPIPRPNPEKNWSPGLSLQTAQGRVEDNVPEDSALVFDTRSGTVILTGCGHAGIVNIAEYARHIVGPQPLLAIVGGLHLFAASDATLTWTGAQLKSFGLQNLLAGHCTGIEATYRLREASGLERKTAVVSAVGSSFTLGRGIDPLELAR
ncbi:MAG TPA: MBL fold metallo-hydrolase [Steroidobacteraceae bacterium]|jgi:7,8-dihydropterin-6-yl-methyl-4-(beta-D-ribofuranosyl)aminobenzene 5'-phosphate synthase